MIPTANSRKSRLTIAPAGRPQLKPLAVAGPSAKSSFSSNELFKGEREIRIEHNEQTYRLTITKLGKLILTK